MKNKDNNKKENNTMNTMIDKQENMKLDLFLKTFSALNQASSK